LFTTNFTVNYIYCGLEYAYCSWTTHQESSNLSNSHLFACHVGESFYMHFQNNLRALQLSHIFCVHHVISCRKGALWLKPIASQLSNIPITFSQDMGHGRSELWTTYWWRVKVAMFSECIIFYFHTPKRKKKASFFALDMKGRKKRLEFNCSHEIGRNCWTGNAVIGNIWRFPEFQRLVLNFDFCCWFSELSRFFKRIVFSHFENCLSFQN
jgi:hypothetical protein